MSRPAKPKTTPHELSNAEIDEHLSRYGKGKVASTRSKDEVTYHDCRGKMTVVNMEDSDKGQGTHWCLLYDCRPDVCIWFDSMGAPPPKKVLRFMKATGKTIEYNPDQLQMLGSIVCGYWCEYIAKLLHSTGYSLQEIVDELKKYTPAVLDAALMKKRV